MAHVRPKSTKNGPQRPKTTKTNRKNGHGHPVTSKESLAPKVEDDQQDDVLSIAANILEGDMSNLPPVSSNVVRIFVSSTFADMRSERDRLMESTFPRLKKYCMDTYGLQFQVVDMRWGVRDEATDDHMTTELCLKELENCQQISVGPNFIAIIGQRYGYRPIPSSLNEWHFCLICETCDKEDVELLHKWYKLDENITSPGPRYILLPVSSVYRHYLNKKNDVLRKEANQKWQDDSKQLSQIMHKASQEMIEKEQLTPSDAHQIHMSVTEREVWHGCLNPSLRNIQDQCLIFERTIENIESVQLSTDPAIWSFRDIKDNGTNDEEAKVLLDDLRKRLVEQIPEENVTSLPPVKWKNGGKIVEHLDIFAATLEAKVKSMVDRVMSHKKTNTDPLYAEVLRHLTLCCSISSKFKGREDLLDQIMNYTNGSSPHPLIIYGNSGSGKTSLMAKSFHMMSQKKKSSINDPVCLIRFLGTSPFSSSLIPLVRSLCQQICSKYGVAFTMHNDLNQLTTFFKKLLSECPTAKKPIYLFLDSLDQLAALDGAHELTWLPSTLTPHVKLVLSFAILPELNLLNKSMQVFPDHEVPTIEVQQFGEELGAVILKSNLAAIKRKLTDDQERIVREAIRKCNMPLYVTLVTEEASRWKSFDPLNVTTLADTIHGSIMLLFQRLEVKHGELLVKQALRHITACKSGIAENELEDLLSLDEDVLNDVYQYHLPPATMRRIPPLLWTRLRSDMAAYITEREANGINVIYWYHRQFVTSARKRYFENQNGNVKARTHASLADYFMGKWYQVPKHFRYTERQMKLKPPAREGEVDRQVADQPLTISQKHYNLRKLNELPYHLVRAGDRLEDLYNHVLFDIEWIVAKIKGVSATEVIADYADALSKKNDACVQLVHDTLKLGLFVINQCPDMVVQEIITRLLPYYKNKEYKFIRQLIQQCDSKGLESNALIPTVHSNHTPGGPLQFVLEGHPWAVTSAKIIRHQGVLVSVSNMIISWDITTGEFLKDIKIPNFTGVLRHMSVSPDASTAVACSKNDIFLFNLGAGKFQPLPQLQELEGPVWGTCMSNDKIWLFSKNTVYCLDRAGNCLDVHKQQNENESIVQVTLTPKGTLCYVIRTGLMNDEHNDATDEVEKGNGNDRNSTQTIDGSEDRQIHMEFPEGDYPQFSCRGPIYHTEDIGTVYACQTDEANLDGQVAGNSERYDPVTIIRYKCNSGAWVDSGIIGKSVERMYAITVSQCEQWLAGTTMYGFQIWNLTDLSMTEVRLPGEHRNLPNRIGTSQLLCYSNCSTKMAAAVREVIYVWDLNNLAKEPRRLPSIHYKRIISLQSVPAHLGNKMISSSFDHSINVWNFDNLRGTTFTVEKHSRPITDVAISSDASHAITVSQKTAKVWDTHTGECITTIDASMSNSKITTAIITSDSRHVISAETTVTTKLADTSVTTHETGLFHVWEVDTGLKKVESDQTSIKQLLLIDNEKLVLAISVKCNTGRGVCRSVATGKIEYQFEYQCPAFQKGISVGNKVVIPALDGRQDVLNVYHARTGSEQKPAIPLVCGTYQDVKDLKVLKKSASTITVVHAGSASIYDIKAKKFIATIPQWNGTCNSDGTLGLVAKDNGDLNIISLPTGSVTRSLLSRSLEMSNQPTAIFAANNKYVLYCNGTHNTLLLIRAQDTSIIGRFYSRAKICSIDTSADNKFLVIGRNDGRCNTLLIADPKEPESTALIGNLPSRAGERLTFRKAVTLTRIKHRVYRSQNSITCAVS